MRTLPAPVLLWIAALCGFIILAAFAAAYDRFPADLWLLRRLQEVDSSAFARTLGRTAEMVNGWELVAVLGAAGLPLLLARRWLETLLLLVSPAASLLNAATKAVIGRPRPSAGLVPFTNYPSDSAFPSGHAESAILIYGLLFYFITISITQPAVRLTGQAACLWVILFTGMQRVYTGVHWPSDVLGGYYLGGLVLAVLIGLHRYLSRAVVTDRSRSRY